MNIFSVNLRNIRTILFPTKVELANKLAISIDTLENWEKGKHAPSGSYGSTPYSGYNPHIKRCSIDDLIRIINDRYSERFPGIIADAKVLLNCSGLPDEIKGMLDECIQTKEFAGKLLMEAFKHHSYRNALSSQIPPDDQDPNLTRGFEEETTSPVIVTNPCLVRLEHSLRDEEFCRKFTKAKTPIYIPLYVPETVPITKDIFVIGRESESVDLVCCNDCVSRRHAEIIRKNGTFYLKDSKSKLGTHINGKLIDKNKEVLLNDRDVISFAHSDYIFIIPKS